MNDFVSREEMERYTETAAIIADNAENAKRRCAVFPLYLVRGLIRVCKDREEPKRPKRCYTNPMKCDGVFYTCPRCFFRIFTESEPAYCSQCGQRIERIWGSEK